jgi:hypothetical protein
MSGKVIVYAFELGPAGSGPKDLKVGRGSVHRWLQRGHHRGSRESRHDHDQHGAPAAPQHLDVVTQFHEGSPGSRGCGPTRAHACR